MTIISEEDISNRQKEILRQAKRREINPNSFIDLFRDFLSDKSDSEPLHPDWEMVWDEYRGAPITRYGRHRSRHPARIVEEIDDIIRSIPKVDEEIYDLSIDEDTKVTFLLGAGASAPSDIPTVGGLFSELRIRAKKIRRDDLDHLMEWCKEQEITNIEDLLTAAYISDFTTENQNITSLVDYFLFSGKIEESKDGQTAQPDVASISFLQDTLQTLFGLLTSTMLSANPNETHEAISNFVSHHDNSSIITTNYDICMDEQLVNDGLGFKETIEGGEEGDDIVSLVKMHGSINWTYCDSCQDTIEYDLNFLKEAYQEDKISYPVIGYCRNCGGQRRPLLVPPISFKFMMFPPLIHIWDSARRHIEEADYLVVVGYSFAEADTYISKIISRSMSENEDQKMVIVNTNPTIADSLRDRFSTYIDGFDKDRLLEARASSELVVPEIVDIFKSELTATGASTQEQVQAED